MVCPASKRCTIPGSVTGTRVGLAGSVDNPVSASGATRPEGSVVVPSGPTSYSLAKRVADPPGAATVSSTVGAPTTSTGPSSGSLSNAANWPGISSVVPPSAAVSAPTPGTVVRDAGVPPGGVTTGWVGPATSTVARSAGSVPSRPG